MLTSPLCCAPPSLIILLSFPLLCGGLLPTLNCVPILGSLLADLSGLELRSVTVRMGAWGECLGEVGEEERTRVGDLGDNEGGPWLCYDINVN